MDVIIMNDSSNHQAFLSTIRNSKPHLLIISPFSKGEKLLNKLDAITDLIGLDYLKRKRYIHSNKDFSKNENFPNLKTIIHLASQFIPRTERLSNVIKFSNEELNEFLQNKKDIEQRSSVLEIYSGEEKRSTHLINYRFNYLFRS